MSSSMAYMQGTVTEPMLKIAGSQSNLVGEFPSVCGAVPYVYNYGIFRGNFSC
jgi:hypothetical protein